MGPPRFELRLRTPQARRIPVYLTAPHNHLSPGIPYYGIYNIDIRYEHSPAAVSVYSELIHGHFRCFLSGKFFVVLIEMPYHRTTRETSYRKLHYITIICMISGTWLLPSVPCISLARPFLGLQLPVNGQSQGTSSLDQASGNTR